MYLIIWAHDQRGITHMHLLASFQSTIYILVATRAPAIFKYFVLTNWLEIVCLCSVLDPIWLCIQIIYKYIYFFSCSNQFEFLPTIGKEHSNSTMAKRILWQMLLNRQKALLILWIHPLRSARVFFHSVSAGPSLGAKGQGADVVQPAVQRTSGRRCLQLLQAVLKATVAVVAMSSRTAKNLLATACVCIGGPTYLPSLLPHLDLVPFGLRLSWSQCRCGRSQ
jgi:hypothetical protein